MMDHKICFNGEIWIIIPKLSLLPLLIWSFDDVSYGQYQQTKETCNGELKSGFSAFIV